MCATILINIDVAEMRQIIDEIERHNNGMEIKTGNVYYKSMLPVLALSNGKVAPRPMYWGLPLEGKKDVNFNAKAENLKRYSISHILL